MQDDVDVTIRLYSRLAVRGFEYSMYNRNHPDNNTQQVLDGMECLAKNIKPQKLRKGKYYRARVIDTKDIVESKGFRFNDSGNICTGFNEEESGRAPESFVRAGRINKEWESIWYLASDAYTAMAEVRPGVREQISVAEYRVNGNYVVNILNFANDRILMKEGFDKTGTALEKYEINEIFVLMQKILTLPAYNERTYFISNIVADMLKNAGVSGVKYKSFYGKGYNLAIWDTDKKIIEYCGSKVYLNYCSNQAFVNIEDGSTINNTTMFNKQIKEGSSKAILEAQKMYKELISKGRR